MVTVSNGCYSLLCGGVDWAGGLLPMSSPNCLLDSAAREWSQTQRGAMSFACYSGCSNGNDLYSMHLSVVVLTGVVNVNHCPCHHLAAHRHQLQNKDHRR